MLGNKLHTFAVLAYKNSSYLEECLVSLKNQTVKSQIYIATSVSSSFLDKIARKYAIPILVNIKSNGIASDWSFAYNQCKTEYLTLAHQDDIYLPNYTEICLKKTKKDSNINNLIIFTGYKELINGKIKKFGFHLLVKNFLLVPFLFKQEINSTLFKKIILSFGNPIPCPTVMYRKNAIGQFEFLDKFQCNMDWDAWLRLSNMKGSFIYVNDVLVLHRINKDSQTTKQIGKRIRQKEDLLIFKRLWPKSIAIFLANIYSFAIKFNKIE